MHEDGNVASMMKVLDRTSDVVALKSSTPGDEVGDATYIGLGVVVFQGEYLSSSMLRMRRHLS